MFEVTNDVKRVGAARKLLTKASDFISDLKILRCMAFHSQKECSPAERLESFYAPQIGSYDRFRSKLLTGREELMRALAPRDGEFWVDMGCGTGANLTFLPPSDLARLGKVLLVDLTDSMLKAAQRRIDEMQWKNVETARADAALWRPAADSVDVVLFSYSLTMIEDWFAAIDRAYEALKPGGRIGVVDFYIARKRPTQGRMNQSFSTRWLWPMWFSFDDLFLTNDLLPYF